MSGLPPSYRVTVVALGVTALTLVSCNTDRALVTEDFGEPAFISAFGVAAVGVPGGTAAVITPATGTGTVNLTLVNLDSLAAGNYHVWLGITGTTAAGVDTVGQFVPATGTIRVIHTDTTVNADSSLTITIDTVTSTGSSFSNGGSDIRVEVSITGATLGSDPLSRNVALVSIEAAASPTTPSVARPFWRRYTRGATAGTSTGPVSFGTFHADPDSQYVWTATGRGIVGFRSRAVEVEDSALARPPVGYYYESYLSNSTSTVSIGEQTAPYPNRSVSLRDADVTVIPGVVIVGPPSLLLAASTRFVGTEATPFRDFTDVLVTLEAKQGPPGLRAPTIVLRAAVPDTVQAGAP